jgi:GxxExxY protein
MDKKLEYFLDFLVENKIVVELKVASNFHPKHLSQVLGYLRAKNLRIGLILLFTKNGLKIKRVMN